MDTSPTTRILVVDDNSTNRLTLSFVLRGLRCDVELAASAQQGLRLLTEKAIDLVFVDLNMPGIDGFEFARRVRDKEGFAELPLVALSGDHSLDLGARCEAAGLNRLLRKPYQPQQLKDVIDEEVLGLRGLTDMRRDQA